MEARAAKVAYDAIKAADPSRPVAGAKGTFPIASWYYAPATDIFGWYGHADMAIANAAAQEFGKMTEPVHVNICQHQTMRGGVPVDKWPFMNYRESAYSLMLTRVIDGAKSIFNEDYVLGHDFHYFHVTKQMRGRDLEGTLGGKVTIDRDDYPDVYMEAKSLQIARANQALLRLAPVFLPTKQHRARVAVLATDAADMHGGPSAYYGTTVMQTVYLLKMCQVPFDVLREPQFGRFKDYDVLVLTGLCEALSPEAAKEVGLFVADGGKLLILLPTAGTDARNLKHLDFTWDALAGCRPGPTIDQGGELPITVNGVAGVEQLPGFKGLQKGKLASLELIGGRLDVLAQVGDKPVAVRSQKVTGHVVTACLPQMVPTWTALPVEPFDARTAKFFGEVFRMWNVARPVEISGPGETHMIDAGVLDGNGCWLVLLASYAPEQKVVAKLDFLPAGSYDVIDMTGERPLITKDEAGQNHLAPDPQYRRCTYVAKDVSDKTLKSVGVSLDIGARMGRVLMVRPAGWQTWADCPDHEIETLARKPLVIVPGTGCEKMAAAVQAHLKAIGNDAQIVSPDAIKTKKVTNKVVILDFPVETFESAPLDVKTNLILIGSETNNPLIKHLGAEGTFCFDKVLEKVDDKYPGPGRGIIEVVESVSNEAYDATTNSCDAIVIAGSDAAGTQAAVNRFIDTLKARR
jgi:hypothetical protein